LCSDKVPSTTSKKEYLGISGTVFMEQMFFLSPNPISVKALKGTQNTNHCQWPGLILSSTTTRLLMEQARLHTHWLSNTNTSVKKVKAFPYSILSIGPGADPGVQAVSLQVTVSHTPGGRLLLLSARPAVTSPAAEHHRPLAGTKLYCSVTEAHRCEQLA